MNTRVLERDLLDLSHKYRLDVDEELQYFIVRGFRLPPGYNRSVIDILIEVPRDYPESPPGVGASSVFVPNGLRFSARIPKDYHERAWIDGWAWWCYSSLAWDPCKDNFITFLEVMRAHMTNPP